jgi:hypothetical protein
MSSSPPTDPDDIINKIAEAGRGVRLGKGVTGKTGHAILALLAIWAIALWRLGPSLVQSAAVLLAAIAATSVFVWWTRATQAFAERNPAQAMLEGAEFLEYQRFEAAAKGRPIPQQDIKGITSAGGSEDAA